MKILILGPFPIENKGLNGQSIANKTLLEGLKKNYSVDFINTAKDLKSINKKEQGKFKICKFLMIIIGLIKEILKILLCKYDVIYMTPGQSLLGFMRFTPYMIVAFLKNTPCYIHIHGGYFRKMYNSQSKIIKQILTFFLRRITGVIVLGNSLRYMFKDLVDNDKIFICENGVEDNIIATKIDIEKKVKKFKNTRKRRIIYLSNLMKEKGILDLLKVTEYFTSSELELHLAGGIEDEIKDEVFFFLNKYPDKIKYHGIVQNEFKKKLLLQSDIFVLPTYYSNEGQPISILEAYVTGCSVITTNQGGIQDIFIDGVNGVLCEAHNVNSIHNGINKLFMDEKYIEHNYYYGLNFFSSKKFIKRIENIIINSN
ncbi:glycosyltransferase family 4 protein [Fusobacterium hominis]|uniref:Glycosyltransferase family 4 protein n=1 Tax=Fusobacterium hominis TaxID=2764326 RepID=A0A7G9GVE7_9FUSO|nr:glycosyltransferase family 4 protein [Fusobacterium hominis]QNM14779.1 glycosyltransferase family 4 protein [Fusobacterium hominis]